jgi:hypothetical protein
MTLLEYLRLPHRWQWGYCDCTLFAADWVVAATGSDPGADLRGTYFDSIGARAVLHAAGGVDLLVGAKLGALGFRRVHAPHDGDIGIVRALTEIDAGASEFKDIPAIKFGPLWAVMSARGPMVKHLDWTGAAWRIA